MYDAKFVQPLNAFPKLLVIFVFLLNVTDSKLVQLLNTLRSNTNSLLGNTIDSNAEQLLNATHVERLIGQVVYYTKRRYTTNNLIVLVVGREKEYGAPMKEIETIIESLGCTFLFKKV